MSSLIFTPDLERKGFLKTYRIESRTTPEAILSEHLGCPAGQIRQVYIEARNLHRVNKDYHGIFVAYRKERDSGWRFGILVDITVAINPTILVLQWKGHVDYQMMPQFLSMSKARFQEGEWRYQFESKIVWSIAEFKYLNLAIGYRPFLPFYATFVGADGGVKCSVDHPDMCPFPLISTLPITKIPLNITSAYLDKDGVKYPQRLVGTIPRKRGRSDKIRGTVPKWAREYDSTYDINWRTVSTYMDSPQTKVLSDMKDKIAFPLVQVPPTDTISIAYLSLEQFDRLVERKNGKLSFQELNDEIQRIVRPNAIFNYRLVDDPRSGVAFRACTKEELPKDMDVVLNDNEMRKAPGILMSCWLEEKSLHPFKVTADYLDLLQYTYGRGFQSRNRCMTLGVNLYLGKRQGNIASSSAATPTEDVSSSQYYRQNYEDVARPFMESTGTQLRRYAIIFAGKLEPTYRFLTPQGLASPCRMLLITAGSKSGTKRNRRVIGFANSPHADTGDILDQSRVNEAKESLSYVKKLSEQGRESVSKHQIEYLETFMERFPPSVPTTCAYQWIRRRYTKEEDGYYSYFVLHSMDWAVRILDGVGHLFYAAHFVHVTTICLISINGKVFFIHPEGNYNLFAWGDCSKEKEPEPSGA